MNHFSHLAAWNQCYKLYLLNATLCLCVLKALLLFLLLSALYPSRGQHWAVEAPACSQPAASIPWCQEPAAAVGRPHPERRAHLAAAQRQRSAQPPLHLRPQVWMGWRVIAQGVCQYIDSFSQIKVHSGFCLNARDHKMVILALLCSSALNQNYKNKSFSCTPWIVSHLRFCFHC